MGNYQKTRGVGLFRIKFLRCWISAGVISLLAVATCFASNATLQWNANTETDLAGYRVYYQADSSAVPFTGTEAAQGASPIDVGKNTSATISGLDPGRAYYVAVTAYNISGLESPYSTIVELAELTPPSSSITYLGSNSTANVSVAVNNNLEDSSNPMISFTAPANGAMSSGTISLSASAIDNIGVTKVEFYRNGELQYTGTVYPYSYSWNTTAVANGDYILSLKAYDAAGNVGQAGIGVTVNN